MRQRVCIARTLVMAPASSSSTSRSARLDQQTRLLMARRSEIVAADRRHDLSHHHALDEAAMLADRIGIMSARPGRLIDVIENRLGPRARQPGHRDRAIRPDHRAAVEIAARGIAQIDGQAATPP